MDIIQPFILEDGLFRGSFIAADKTISLATGCHSYPDYVNDIIAQLILTGLFLSSSIKYEGTFTLQIKGDGPIQSVVVEITHDDKVRAYARFDETQKPKSTALSDMFGNGKLAFAVSMLGKEPYQGVVALSGDTIAQTVLNYLNQSEQLPTHLLLREKNRLYRGIFVQQMPAKKDKTPEEQADLFETVGVLLHSLTNQELFSDIPVQNLLFRLFHANQLTIFDPKTPAFCCACYPDKIKSYLTHFPKEQLNNLFQDDKIEAQCEFCGQKYTFTRKDFE